MCTGKFPRYVPVKYQSDNRKKDCEKEHHKIAGSSHTGRRIDHPCHQSPDLSLHDHGHIKTQRVQNSWSKHSQKIPQHITSDDVNSQIRNPESSNLRSSLSINFIKISFQKTFENQKNRFLERMIAATTLIATEIRIMIRNPNGLLDKGIPEPATFIP